MYFVKLTEDNVEDVISRINFSAPEVNSDYGNVSIKVSITDEEGNPRNLAVETPWMRAFVGVSTFEAQSRKGDTYKKYNLPVSFNNLGDPKQAVYRKFIELFDQKLIDAGYDNAASWLKQAGQPKAVIKAFYSAQLKHSKNKDGSINENYPPRTQFKLPAYRNKDTPGETFSTQVYKDQETRMSVTEIEKGAQVKNLVECTGIWVVNGKFGAGWRSLQMRVKNPANRNAYAFQEDSDDEDESPAATAD
jgi:hypothetical protein